MHVSVRSGFGRGTEAPVMYMAVVDGKQHRAASTGGVSSGILHYAKFLIIRYVDGNIKNSLE